MTLKTAHVDGARPSSKQEGVVGKAPRISLGMGHFFRGMLSKAMVFRVFLLNTSLCVISSKRAGTRETQAPGQPQITVSGEDLQERVQEIREVRTSRLIS